MIYNVDINFDTVIIFRTVKLILKKCNKEYLVSSVSYEWQNGLKQQNSTKTNIHYKLINSNFHFF